MEVTLTIDWSDPICKFEIGDVVQRTTPSRPARFEVIQNTGHCIIKRLDPIPPRVPNCNPKWEKILKEISKYESDGMTIYCSVSQLNKLFKKYGTSNQNR